MIINHHILKFSLLHNPLFLGVVILSIMAGTVISLTLFHELSPHRIITVKANDLHELKHMTSAQLVTHFKTNCQPKGVGIIGKDNIEIYVCEDGAFGIFPKKVISPNEEQ